MIGCDLSDGRALRRWVGVVVVAILLYRVGIVASLVDEVVHGLAATGFGALCLIVSKQIRL